MSDLTVFGTMSLGSLTRSLGRFDHEAHVWFDFCRMAPTLLIGSYRGFYDHLRIGYGRAECRVGDLLRVLERADGDVFEGYKGGSYRMSSVTPVWVDVHGECTSTAILDVTRLYDDALIVTGYAEV